MKKDFNPTDPLAARLCNDALLNQPPFSSNLHRQILQAIRDDSESPRRRWVWQIRIAAAIALLASLLFAWNLQSHQRPMQAITNDQPATQTFSDSPSKSETPLVFLATIWPPQITLSLGNNSADVDSSATDQPPIQPSAPIAPAQWVITSLQAPATSAQDVLASLVPPQVHGFLAIMQR